MGKGLEGQHYQRQVVPVRVLSERSVGSTRFETPVMTHRLYQVVCAKVSKQVITAINERISGGTHNTVSDIVRDALALYLDVHDTPV